MYMFSYFTAQCYLIGSVMHSLIYSWYFTSDRNPTSRYEVKLLKQTLHEMLDKAGLYEEDVELKGPTQVFSLIWCTSSYNNNNNIYLIKHPYKLELFKGVVQIICNIIIFKRFKW